MHSIHPSESFNKSEQKNATVQNANVPSDDRTSMRMVDSDSLSVILSFLPTRDFLRATRISKEWRRISDRPAAWPKRLETSQYIDLLLSDDIENSHRRRLDLKWSKDLLHDNARVNPHFHQATEIRLVYDEKSNPVVQDEQLPNFRLFPSCTALTLVNHNPQAHKWILTHHGGQLQFLSLSGLWAGFFQELAMAHFSSLRILITHHDISDNLLGKLHGLEYFHIHTQWNPFGCEPLFRVVRTLSIQHNLRHFSLSGSGPTAALTMAVKVLYRSSTANQDNDAAEYPPALLHSLSLVSGKGLVTVELAALLSRLPALTDVTCTVQGDQIGAAVQPPEDAILDVSRLKRFKLIASPAAVVSPLTIALSHSETMQSFTIEQRPTVSTWDKSGVMNVLEFLSTNLIHLPHLTDLIWADSVVTPKDHSLRTLFALLHHTCPELKRMDLSILPMAPLEMIALELSALDAFETLEVTAFISESYTQRFQLPHGLLVAVGASPTWRQLIVHMESDIVKSPGIAPGHITYEWFIEDHQSIEGPTMEDILSHLRDPTKVHEVRRRILDFRLWRYGSEIECFKPVVNRRGKFEWCEV